MACPAYALPPAFIVTPSFTTMFDSLRTSFHVPSLPPAGGDGGDRAAAVAAVAATYPAAPSGTLLGVSFVRPLPRAEHPSVRWVVAVVATVAGLGVNAAAVAARTARRQVGRSATAAATATARCLVMRMAATAASPAVTAPVPAVTSPTPPTPTPPTGRCS